MSNIIKQRQLQVPVLGWYYTYFLSPNKKKLLHSGKVIKDEDLWHSAASLPKLLIHAHPCFFISFVVQSSSFAANSIFLALELSMLAGFAILSNRVPLCDASMSGLATQNT